MADAVTIDNIGIQHSNRFALDQQYGEPGLVDNAKFGQQAAQVDASDSFKQTDLANLFQTNRRNLTWSLFNSPDGFLWQTARVFTAHPIACLGSEEFQQARIDKVRQYSEQRSQSGKEKATGNQEAATLLGLLTCLQTIDRELKAINARRSQYSKG